MSGRWLAGKLVGAVVTIAFVIIFNFFLFRVMGDPTTQLARLPGSSPEEIEKLKADYGLDKPLLGQFTDYVGDTLTLDLGVSQQRSRTRCPGPCCWSAPGRCWRRCWVAGWG